MNLKIKNLCSFRTVLAAGILACALFLIPPLRAFLVNTLAALLIGRPLRDFGKWDDIIAHTLNLLITAQVCWFFFCYTARGKQIGLQIYHEAADIFRSPASRKNLLILGIMYALCFFALIHSNYDNADDIRRVYAGQRAWAGFSRYVSEYLSIFVHTNININDITPFTQIIALLALTVASFLLAYIFTNGKITFVSLAAAALAGASPFFVSNFAYKFDCPYMALAMLFSIVPFVFAEKKAPFAMLSFICLLLVCTSYQAANGAYIVMAIVLTMRLCLKRKPAKECLQFALAAAGCYIAAMVFFRLFLMNIIVGTDISRGTGTAGGLRVFSVCAANFLQYSRNILDGYGNTWIRVCTAVLVALFPVAAAVLAKRTAAEADTKARIIPAVLLSLAALALMFVFSFGAYLILEQPLFSGRTYMGFDVLLAAVVLFDVSVFTAGAAKKIAAVCTVALFYGCAVFATVFGNMQVQQHDYEDFRFSLVLQDLNHIVDPEADNSFYIGGITGPAGKTRIAKQNYGLCPGSISPVLTHYILKGYNMYFEVLSEATLEELTPEETVRFTDLPLIVDTYYHAIYGKGTQYYIYLKNIPEKILGKNVRS